VSQFKKDLPAPSERKSSDGEGDDFTDLERIGSKSDFSAFDNKSTLEIGRMHQLRVTPTSATSVVEISGDRDIVNIYVDPNKRKSMDKATITPEKMRQFINELECADRSNRFVPAGKDKWIYLTCTKRQKCAPPYSSYTVQVYVQYS